MMDMAASGLKVLQEKHLIHRDLKPQVLYRLNPTKKCRDSKALIFFIFLLLCIS